MNSIRSLSLLALPFLTIAAGAQTSADSQKLPDRPAVAVASQGSDWKAVVGAEGSAPIIASDGNAVTVKGPTRLMLLPGGKYGRGFITISDLLTKDVQKTNDPDVAADMEDTMASNMEPTSETLKASLTSDTDIPDAYALIIANRASAKLDAPPTLAIYVSNLGDLKAGATSNLSVVLPKVDPGYATDWNILVYSGGKQVRSTDMGKILPAYFDKIDTFQLKKTIADRVSKGADAPIASFRQMPLGLPASVLAKYHGTQIKVAINVGPDGHVTQASPVGLNDADLSEAISRGFARWLFVPPMKNGALASGSAIIPVKL